MQTFASMENLLCIAEDSIIVDLEHQVMEPCRKFSITIINSQSLYISQKNEGEDF